MGPNVQDVKSLLRQNYSLFREQNLKTPSEQLLQIICDGAKLEVINKSSFIKRSNIKNNIDLNKNKEIFSSCGSILGSILSPEYIYGENMDV